MASTCRETTMARTHHAYKRLTNRYRAAYDHLNERQYLGWSFREVSNGKQYWDVSGRTGEVEYDAGYTRFLRLTASRPVTRQEMEDTLYVYRRECACEHDCCGHYSGGAQTSLLRPVGRLHGGKARRWIVPVHYSPNL
jgi:hypothetical protein